MAHAIRRRLPEVGEPYFDVVDRHSRELLGRVFRDGPGLPWRVAMPSFGGRPDVVLPGTFASVRAAVAEILYAHEPEEE